MSASQPASSGSTSLRRLLEGPNGPFWGRAEIGLSEAIASAPDPVLALSGLERLDPAPGLLEALEGPGLPGRLPDLLRLLSVGPFMIDQMERTPSRIRPLLEGARPPEDPLPPQDDFEDLDGWLTSLNRYKRTALASIAARSVLGRGTLDEELVALSDMADRILESVLLALTPPESPRPAVIALGKHGGRELNFSSDLDLMFTSDLPGGVPIASTLPPVIRTVERFVEALTRYTVEGSLYRVDLRLRPGGDRAPLVRTVRGMESYYAERGAPWERQMLVKGRVCAGDGVAGGDLLDRLTPFVYPAHAETDPGEEAHRLRRERRAREGGGSESRHVKLAPGGIRDVEFVVQVLQLLYGGRRPRVRTPATLDGIHRLRAEGLLPAPEAEGLEASYRFLRRAEHLLQMEEDRQTFLLPSGGRRLDALGRLTGHPDGRAFRSAYDAHRHDVSSILHGLLPGAGEERTGDPLEELLTLPAGGEEAERRLAARGFRDPAQSHRVLVATGSGIRAAGSNAWAAFVGLLPLLLKDAEATGAPDRALNNLERILRRLGSPGAYVRLLAREAAVRRALLALCASGELLTTLVVRHPEHFERMFSTLAAAAAADPSGWRRRLREERRRATGPAEFARRLETIRTRETLAIGLAYAVGEADLDGTMSALGGLARDLIGTYLGLHFGAYMRPPRAGVLALGTLAAGHMTFSSDADLLFLHGSGADAEIQTVAARVAGMLSPPGGPYPVDMRLRPEGRSAPASVDISYLGTYLSERASPWEALALYRSRPFYGRRAVLGPAEEALGSWLAGFRLDEETRSHLRAVRDRQVAALGGETGFDVKRSAGGMADVEFLALSLTLASRSSAEVRVPHIPALLEDLVGRGRLPEEEGLFLRSHYQRLRGVQVGLQMHMGRDATRLPEAWEDPPPAPGILDVTAADLAGDAGRTRALFDRHFPTD